MAFLTMVSMGAWSQIDVQITNGGKFDGGSIKYIDQTKPDEKGFVTVTITVIPDKEKGYTISKNDITVVSTYPLSDPDAGTRTPEIADNLILYFEGSADADIDDLSAERYYTFKVPSDFGAWVKEANFQSGGSKGPSRNVTTITSLNQLTTSGSFIIIADIDATGYNSLASFTGTLTARPKADGSYPVIRGLRRPLFTKVTDAVISNLMFDDVIISESGITGTVACTANGASRIYNIGILSGEVGSTGTSSSNDSKDCCGGVVGYLDGTAHVVNCFSYATITGGNRVAGIVGYNNVSSTSTNLKTMVMNCMFYGDITGGNSVFPVYGGKKIDNMKDNGLNTFNYYAFSQLKSKSITYYYCALAVEDKYLNRFEIYRQLLNSNKKLAAIYASNANNTVNPNDMAKWVLETADRTINDPKPYPVLKAQGRYPSIINYDADHATAELDRNKGGLLGTLTVNISSSHTAGQDWPEGASISTSSLTLKRTDKDAARFNYNYDKVQLPYYNDVGSGNYTHNRVVTGWIITAITPIDDDPYSSTNYPTTGVKDFPDHNYADRKSSNKDLYTVSKRVFSQGAYFDVPYGVSSITIEPYWAKAAYISDPNYDVVYAKDFSGKTNVTNLGTQVTVGTTLFNDQRIETSVANALNYINNNLGGFGPTVYDNAVVLVGNLHLDGVPSGGDDPFTMMSVDENEDNEPDYSLIYHHKDRLALAPIRFDFLNVPGTSQAQRPSEATLVCNVSIFKTKGWFEITNTSMMYFTQFEYENQANISKEDSPLILMGGIIDQFVSTQSTDVKGNTIYIHVGSNVWIKEFGMGTHSDGSKATPHVPVSVTGGDYPGFYLTGTYNQDAGVKADNAECYISGGNFGEVAGASLEQINGNVRWQIYDADIENFFGGGINSAKPIKGDVKVEIFNSHVLTYCGGPKFGDMQSGKTVETTAEGCVFDRFFGAGYGGTAYTRKKYYDTQAPNWSTWASVYTTDRGNYFNGTTTPVPGDAKYGKKGVGVAADFDYEFFVWSKGNTGGRFFVKFASFSLAQCNDVSSSLKNCTINGDFYGGGNLGKVTGTATSVLDGCTVTGSVFGGGYSATLPKVMVRDAGFTKNPNYNSGSGMFEPAEYSGLTEFEWKNANLSGVTLNNGESGSDLTNHYIYTNVDLTGLGQVKETKLTIQGNTVVNGIVDGQATGGVYGGGDESMTNNSTLVNINNGTVNQVFGGGNKANVGGSVTVNINGGTITKDVYGGGALANTNVNNTTSTAVNTTTVNLHNGTINGNVYGGGLGRRANAEQGITAMIALVGGDVTVNLNSTEVDDGQGHKSYPDQCVVKGSVFGCNNLMGTPTGNVTVHIYKTWGEAWTPEEILDDIDDTKHKYHLAAVYGGGNLAAYEPTNAYSTDAATKAKAYAHVIIDGCGLTSIRQVYGGGNAASTPATKVDIKGSYEIEELFGGGNGKDPIDENTPNPGANVGFKDYTAVENEYDTREKRQQEFFVNNYTYGSGQAEVNMYGGLVHRIYGGSNTKGNVRIVAVTMLDEQSGCAFNVDQAYGGGKSAPMDGRAELKMACVPGLKVAYGGAEEADIQNDVILNLTNGNFDRVFGGNNVNGTIHGKITVNIEETGCHLISIGQLYGGGNQAPYIGPLENGTRVGPTINVKSFSSIGEIYGGGYGKTAVVTGDTHVNINVCMGKDFGETEVAEAARVNQHTGEQTISFSQFKRNDDPSTGYFVLDEDGHRVVEDKTETVTLPEFVPGKIGAITNIYGGGNEAEVVGNTYVNIGTESTVDFETGVGSAEPLQNVTVDGVDIRGNVYGGGNQANVTGKTNVVIGRKETPASPARASEPPSESQPVTP